MDSIGTSAQPPPLGAQQELVALPLIGGGV
jgi:hypothetical protein